MRLKHKKLLIVCVLVGVVGLAAGLYAWWRLSAEDAWHEAVASLKRSGAIVEWSAMSPPPIPEDENAAVLYEKAYACFLKLSEAKRDRFRELARKLEDLTPAEDNEARALLREVASVFPLLSEAAGRHRCRFSIDYDKPLWQLVDFSETHKLNLPLALRVRMLADDGRATEALARCEEMIALGRALHDQPCTMSALVMGWVVAEQGFVQIERVLDRGEPDVESLRHLLPVLASGLTREDFIRAEEGQRCDLVAMVAHVVDAFDRPSDASQAPRNWWQRIMAGFARGGVYRDGLACLDIMNASVRLAALPSREALAGYRELAERAERLSGGDVDHPRVAGLMGRAVYRTSAHFDCFLARRDCTRLGVALRLHRVKHGVYPDDLAALVPTFIESVPTDPFSGGDYVYRREGKGIVVYSVGPNAEDDGGRDGRRDNMSVFVGDIVVRFSR